MILGDFGLFERSDFITAFSTSIFIFFTFLVVIVLLNVLIAIISDSYEKSLIHSKNLFGRARVLLLSEIVSFQDLFCDVTKDKSSKGDDKLPCWNLTWIKWTKGGFIFICASAFVVLSWIILEISASVSGDYGDARFSVGIIFINVGILVVLVTVLSRRVFIHSKLQPLFGGRFYAKPIQALMLRLLGTSEESFNKEDEWRGRVVHLQNEMARISLEDSRKTQAILSKEVRKLELKIEAQRTESEEKLIHHLRLSEQRIESMMNEFKLEMQKCIFKSKS